MRGEAVPQRMNADPLGDAGTPGCQANDPMQLARTRMLPAVAGKQPGLTGRHPALLAREMPRLPRTGVSPAPPPPGFAPPAVLGDDHRLVQRLPQQRREVLGSGWPASRIAGLT